MGISACTQTAIIDCYFLILHRQIMEKAIKIRKKCKRFRILIIGRSNAGKTTILKKVCNSINEPMIKSWSGEKVRGILFCVQSILVNRNTCRSMHRFSTLLSRSDSMNTSRMNLTLFTVYIYSVESTVSTTNWFLKAIQDSYFTTLADSKQALTTSWN
jgi:GTPase Era involved in 16S rRNA processing